MDTLVLGLGPVGLLTSYIKKVPCVGEQLGGDARLRRLVPTVIWYSPATSGILQELELSQEVEEVRFGFWGPRGITQDVTPTERAEYLRRSGRDPAAELTSAISSGASGSLLGYKVTVEELCAALGARCDVRVGKVSGILPDLLEGRVRVQATCGELLPDLLINTLPAPVFDKLLRGEFTTRPWCAGSKWFIEGLSWSALLREARDSGLRWLYVSDPCVPFDRVTIRPHGFSYEFNSQPPTWFWDDVVGEVVGPLPLQVLGDPRAAIEFGGLVRHVGRMARWDHRIRIHNVVDEVVYV